MTPKQFEQFVEVILKQLDYFKESTFARNVRVPGIRQPGHYEIDIAIRAKIAGFIDFFLIVECKNWKKPVDRPVVQKIAQTRDAIGAHKGVIVSSVGFTKEATEVAAVHGIGLWVLAEANSKLEVVLGYAPDFLGIMKASSIISLCDSLGFIFREQYKRGATITVPNIKLVDESGKTLDLVLSDFKESSPSTVQKLPFPVYAISKLVGVLQSPQDSCVLGHDKRLGLTQLAHELLGKRVFTAVP